MNNKKRILLTFDLGEICNDLLAKCNLISKSYKDDAMNDIKASVQEPDNPETRSIICRAVTEGFGQVKVACQRYLNVGRTTDTNALERLVKRLIYKKDQQGNDTDEIDTIEFEKIALTLDIPNFNTSVTDDLKSSIHRYVVDYVMGEFLQDLDADKATEYKGLAEGKDYRAIGNDLNCRESYTRRSGSWI